MLHSIPDEKYGAFTAPMSHAIEACVHCGFCLAACPTYQELGQEMDTPRGRIVLMKQVLEGALPVAAAQPHVDRCLGCLACEPACPSGVSYRDLISPFRSVAASQFRRPWDSRVRRWLAGRTLPFPARLRLAATVGAWFRRAPGLVPNAFRPMLALLPHSSTSETHWPPVVAAQGERRARVALLLGCAQRVFCPDINQASIEVLRRNGVEVVIPAAQACCGGLAWHTGDLSAAQRFARQNVRAFPTDLDAVLTNAAGCGSAMHEYCVILRGTPDQPAAERLSSHVWDIATFLIRLGMREAPRGWGEKHRVVYQDACHLLNAQRVRDEPRQLLQSIPNLDLCEVAEPQTCCGSAGTYNLDQPGIAASLGEKKAKNLMATGAELIATGNIGCMLQVQTHLARLGSKLAVRHTMQLLRDAYEGRWTG